MIGNAVPYSSYQESGASWLGKVPEHWSIKPGLAAFREAHTKNVGLIEKQVLSLSYGRIVVKPKERLHGLVPDSFETYQIVCPGDIVIRPTDLQNDWNSLRVGYVRDKGIITSAYICLRPTPLVSARYAYELLNCYDLCKVFYGLGSGLRQNLDWSDFKRLPVAIPPPDEQAAIVRFLDHALAKIDKAIRAKRKTIALLGEQKQAIIHRAVTRGLNPDAPLKDSGIPWLGQVPVHWEIWPFVRCAIERADYRGATPEKVESGIFLVTAKNVRQGQIDYEVSKEFVRASDYASIMRRGLPKIGDVLLTMEAPLGNVALIDREDIALAQRVVRFRLDQQKLLSEFALNCLNSFYFQSQLHERATGSTAQGIKASKLPQLLVALPPTTEQRAIVGSIEKESAPIRAASEKVRKEVALLSEYRTRLIADVVTGKLDVREAAAKLPAMGSPDEIRDAPLIEEPGLHPGYEEADDDELVEEAT